MRSPESLRDPAGILVRRKDQVFRLITKDGEENARAFLTSRSIARRCTDGSCVRTFPLPKAEWPNVSGIEHAVEVLAHETIPFPSYPYEWTPGMLAAAGGLTLDIARDLLVEGRGLKDATPFNILFRGSHAVFVDALSVEKRDPQDPIWFAYGQFVRTFVLPLVAARDLGWTLRQSLSGARDGLDPAALYARLSWPALLRRPSRSAITGPVLLAKLGFAMTVPTIDRRRAEVPRARFVFEKILDQLERMVNSAMSHETTSEWTEYSDPSVHPAEYHAVRMQIVTDTLATLHPRRLLDVGTNDGTFAFIAAALGAEVVAIDRDEAVVEQTFQRASAESRDILPLVVDLSDPTPATGWRNLERRSFLQRATNHFDAVLCLAVLHHLVVGDGLALGDVMSLLSTLTTDLLVAEFVPSSDIWCKKLARGRPVEENRWSESAFEVEAARWFTITERHTSGLRGRTIYVLRRKSR